jgi:hypothetical protein
MYDSPTVSLLELTYRKPFKRPYAYIYASPIFSAGGKIGKIATTTKQIGKNVNSFNSG